MSETEVVKIAESMGLKKINHADKDSVIFGILDKQAADHASTAVANGNSDRERPKRERISKRAEKTATARPDETSAVENVTTPPGQDKQVRTRGRKPKKAQAAPAVETKPLEMPRMDSVDPSELPVPPTEAKTGDEEVAAEQPKAKRGRKSKNESKNNDAQPVETSEVAEVQLPVADEPVDAQAEQPAEAPRRRGRKSNAQKAAEAAAREQQANEQESSAEVAAPVENAVVAEPANAPEAQAEAKTNNTETPADENRRDGDEQQQQPQHRDFRPSKDSSLGQFFPRSEGRRFVPRSQREKEEAAAQINTAPIIIQEPGAQRQLAQQGGQPLPGQGKKNKKNRNNQPQQQPMQQQMREPMYNFENFLEASGVLEVMPEGYGFLRSSDYNYLNSPDDVYITQSQIKNYGLKSGDVVECTVRPPREGEKYFPMNQATRINGRSPEFIRDRVPFEHLTPLFPNEKFNLTGGESCNISTRVVDMFAPIGKGQRGLIVAPPKTGKTLLLKDIANAIAENHPETYIMI
nr:hypothetical protein [Muribaculaceae bacterium]